MNTPVFAHGHINALLPLAPVEDDAGRRAALASLLQTAAAARTAEQALASQISMAVDHKRDADARAAAASAATIAAKSAAARATADWIGGDPSSSRPDTTGPVIAAQNAEAEAVADAETVNGALEALRRDMGAACQRATDAHAAARMAAQRIAMADAEGLARDILASDAATMILRRRLRAFARQIGGGVTVPAAIYEAANAKPPYDDWHNHLAAAESQAWADYREALMRHADALADFPGA